MRLLYAGCIRMKLVTKRLILRDLTLKDAKDVAKNAHDFDVWYYTSQIPYPYKLKDAKKWIKSLQKKRKEKLRNSYEFGIELKSEKKVIGAIGVTNINKQHRKACIGYWLGERYRKKGIISEAEKAILDFAFNKLKLNKLYGQAILGNEGSNKLFKKFGFRKIGIEKEELIKDNKKLGIKNKKVDCGRWELLKKDWKKRR